MQTVDEKPETIHLYVVQEKEPTPSVLPIILSALSLAVLFTFCALIPYQQPVTRAVIRVPAVLLPIRTFTASAAVIPTGIRTYPATTAHGWITFTNGSIIGQDIPAGFTIDGVATDGAVYVPGGNANGYGWAQVTAHAGNPGKNGNIPALAIDSVIGSSVFVRNVSAFSGGRDAYSVKYITSNDRTLALSNIRIILSSKITGLHYPCTEYVNNKKPYVNIYVSWRCQFVRYELPSYMRISSIRIIGKSLLIAVTFTPRQVRVGMK